MVRSSDIRHLAGSCPPWFGYSVAIVLASLATAARFAVGGQLANIQPFAFFYVVTAIVAWWAGLGPAIFAVALGLVVGVAFFLDAGLSLSVFTVIPVTVYLANSTVFVVMARMARRAHIQSIQSEQRMRETESEVKQHNTLLVAELRLHQAFADAPIGMVLTDLDGRLLHMNAAYCKLTGYTEAELIERQMNFRQLTHREDVEHNNEQYRRLLAGELTAFFIEKRYIRKDGSPIWVRVSAALRRNLQGQPAQIIGLVEDISERKRVEEESRRATTLIRAITDHTGDAIFAKDFSGGVTFANPATLRLIGKPLDQVIGRNDAELLQDKAAAAIVMANDRRIMASGVAEDLEEIVPLPDGTRRVWYSRKMPYRDESGRVIGLLGVSRDITVRKTAEEKLHASEHRHRELARVLEAERAKLRAVIENLPVGIVIASPTGRPQSMNRAALQLHGFRTEEEMLPTIDRYDAQFELCELDGSVVPGERWPGTLAMHGEYVRNYVVRLRNHSRNSENVVAYTAVPIRNEEGVVHLLVFVMHDLTEQFRAKESLRETEEHLRNLLIREADIRQTLELAMRAGRIGTFEWRAWESRHLWSKETEEFFGYGPGEFPGTDEAALARVHPEDRERLGPALSPVLRCSEGDHSVEFRVLHPDGATAWLVARGHVECGVDGSAARVVGVVVDITAMKLSEQELAEARDQLARHAAKLEQTVAERTAKLRETVHELEAFSYSLSHDMRAPLRAMKGFAQILEADFGGQLGAEGGAHLQRISRAAGRLDQLIQDVLTYSRIVREHINLQPIDVERLAQQLIEENPALQPPNADIEVRAPMHPVLGHEAYFMQVLSNLVYNAVKFVPQGRQPCVRIWTESVDSQVRVFVEDNGIGIPPEAQERMFEMFQRLHNDQAYEGTGIGLTIVRKAVERMGGTVGVVSSPGNGSTFWVQLKRP